MSDFDILMPSQNRRRQRSKSYLPCCPYHFAINGSLLLNRTALHSPPSNRARYARPQTTALNPCCRWMQDRALTRHVLKATLSCRTLSGQSRKQNKIEKLDVARRREAIVFKLGYFFIFPPDIICIQQKQLMRCTRSLTDHFIVCCCSQRVQALCSTAICRFGT